MSTQQREPFGQQSQSTVLQRRATNIDHLSSAPDFESQGSSHGQGQDGHILVHFNGHFNGQFNGAFVLPNTTYQNAAPESDAQIAARRAMTKRSSRSFAARVSRTRSRKMEVVGKLAKPGITVDTSFTRHKGNSPHQVYPQENEEESSGSTRKQGWFGLGRSGTKTKGLGITKGTPQPGHPSNSSTPRMPPHKATSSTGREADPHGADYPVAKDPKTADSLTPGSKTWQEISPWDRQIPIGISVPSDSVTDFSSYQTTRHRSDSDATLATPSIIITPAAAMKSVWSPDTESDYNSARASSMYSRATFMQSARPDVPPVPALPTNAFKLSQGKSSSDAHADSNGAFPCHTRNDTLDSAGTAFEEEEDDMKRKDRVISTGTVFEEDDTPLRDRNIYSTLSVDTSTLPTPRRSQGWWNVITTPFVMSRRNSGWTQNGRNPEKTPGVPTIPIGYGPHKDSPSTPSTYIWSATERSASVRGDSPLLPPSLSTNLSTPNASESSRSQHVDQENSVKIPPMPRSQGEANDRKAAIAGAASVGQQATPHQAQQTPSSSDHNVTSPLSAMSASPVVGTAAIGTVLMPRQVEEQSRPIHVNIELQDRRQEKNAQTANTNAPPTTLPAQIPPEYPKLFNVDRSTSKDHTSPQAVPVFPPPPTFAQKGSHFSYDNGSRASTPVSSAPASDFKGEKKHRKVDNIMSRLALWRRKKGANGQGKKTRKKRSRCFLCCGCCIIILVLLAIIIPLVVVFTKKNNGGTKGTTPDQEPPSQWLNMTGYPPIPTGVSTIAQPEAVEEENGCIAPATLWSCALPKEQQVDISPNKPDQPNFKLQIAFENGTARDPSKTRPAKRAANPVSAGAFIRSRFLNIRAAPSASPAPPSVEEMKFLGQTTEENSAPFEGEETPFFISFQDPKSAASSRLFKRDVDPTNITGVIPPPDLNPDGTAAPADLLPFPSGQPLRLFNRGKPNEHYGFYTYFDRSIFLKDINATTGQGRGGNPADTDGGSRRDAASVRCTYSQTRILVQIWTNSQTTKPLLEGSARNGSETSLNRPGTFPYPVTVTLDRHGGDFQTKNLYCYMMENDLTIIDKPANKFFWFEDRAFGGNLVNGTQGKQNITGPIDGGSGGCRCQWQNWLN